MVDARINCNNERRAVVAVPPKGEYKKCCANPVTVHGSLKPVSVMKTDEGFIYDFGKNNAGLCKLKIDGRSGQKIDLYYGEVINHGRFDIKNVTNAKTPEGYAQHDVYICKDGVQEYMPSFTYHGFRYVLVCGITDKQATKELLEYKIIHSDIKKNGYFKCSNEIVNKIQECTVTSDLSNLVNIPTDCPQREKNGWTADAALSAEQFMYNLDCRATLEEWLAGVRKAQKSDGRLPGIIPTAGWGFEWGNGPAWDSVLIELPYMLYKFYGDKKVIEDNIENILLYIEYLSGKTNDDGL